MSLGDEISREATDDDLLLAAARGDADAFRRLHDRVAPYVFALCVRMLARREDAEDAYSDVMLEAWARAKNFEPTKAGARTYIMLIARSRLLDRLRKDASLRSRRRRFEEEVGATRAEATREVGVEAELAEWAQRSREAIQSLPRDQQTAIQLAFYEGLSHREIAERCRIPLGTVKGRIRQGILKLRAALQGLCTIL